MASHSVEYGTQEVESLSNTDLDRMKAAGARWVRVNVDFSSIYPTSGDFSGDTPDYASIGLSEIQYAHSIGLQVLAQLAFVPTWMQISGGTYPSSPPNSYSNWATMCARAYRDLHTYVAAYEIWNEPNISQFWVESGAWTYPSLLRQAVIAIRTQADIAGAWSDPFIISGGLASSGSGSTNWTDQWDRNYNPIGSPDGNLSMGTALDKLFDATNGIVPGNTVNTAYVDGYGVHTYIWGRGPGTALDPYFENPPKHCFQNTGTIGANYVGSASGGFNFWTDIVCAHESYATPSAPPAGHKHLWATESGWPATTGVYTAKGSEAQAAAEMDAIWLAWESQPGAGPMFNFPLHDGTYGDEVNLYGGLLRADGSAKPLRGVFRAHALNYAPTVVVGSTTGWSGSTETWSDPTHTWAGGTITTGGGGGGSQPTIFKIELGLSPTASNDTTSFVLNDGTRGALNNTTYRLAPSTVWFDVTNDVQQVDFFRGINRELDRAQPGTMTVQLRNDRPNTSRDYDPNNWNSPYFPRLQPRSRMRVSVDGVPRFSGLIENIENFHGDYGKTASVTFSCVDSLVLLNHDITYTPKHEQDAVSRINLLLDLVDYRKVRFLLGGAETYEAGIERDGTVLDMISEIVTSERGLFFVDANDVLVFLPNSALAAKTPALTITDQRTDTYRYSQIDEQTGTELFYSRIRNTATGAELPHTMTAISHGSMSRYGLTRVLQLDLPMTNALRRQYLADQLLANYSIPKTRFRNVVIQPRRLSTADRQALMRLDIGSVVTVKRTPLGGGFPATVSQDCVVIGISDSMNSDGEFTTAFTLQWRNS